MPSNTSRKKRQNGTWLHFLASLLASSPVDGALSQCEGKSTRKSTKNRPERITASPTHLTAALPGHKDGSHCFVDQNVFRCLPLNSKPSENRSICTVTLYNRRCCPVPNHLRSEECLLLTVTQTHCLNSMWTLVDHHPESFG